MNKKLILIVDDVEMNRDMLADIFEGEYNVVLAQDGREALDIINEKQDCIKAILLDIFMPNMNGTELLHILHDKGVIYKIPILMITTDNSAAAEKECFDLGATDFIKKPFNDVLVRTRVNNAVNLFSYKNHLEEKVSQQTAKIEETKRNIVDILGNLVESRNLESGEHVQRVKKYTNELAKVMMKLYPEYKLDGHKIDVITRAAALHDLGKIAILDAILLKPGRLTDEEFAEMKTHTTKGSDYIKEITNVWDEEYGHVSYEIARYHHERFDGRGYPEGLKEDEIPISAQLVSVADVYDALVHERCYKDAFSPEKAYEMIINNECGVFSPKLIECFKVCFPKFESFKM